MSIVRRRVLRPQRAAHQVDPRTQQSIDKCRAQLEREQVLLDRWMSRLRRAFHALEKQQQRTSRLQRRLAQLETS